MKINLNKKLITIILTIYFILSVALGLMYIHFNIGTDKNIYSIFFWKLLDVIIFFYIYMLYYNINKFLQKKNEINLFPLFIIFIIILGANNFIDYIPNSHIVQNIFHIKNINVVTISIAIVYTAYLSIISYILLNISYNWLIYIISLTKNQNKANLNIKYYNQNINFISKLGTFIIIGSVILLLFIDFYPIIHHRLLGEISINKINLHNLIKTNFLKLTVTIIIYLGVIFFAVIYPSKIISQNFFIKAKEKYIAYLIEEEKEFFKSKNKEGINYNSKTDKINYIANLFDKIENTILNYNKINLFNMIKYSLPVIIEFISYILKFLS